MSAMHLNYCPNCGRDGIEETTLGGLGETSRNWARCVHRCGWSARVVTSNKTGEVVRLEWEERP